MRSFPPSILNIVNLADVLKVVTIGIYMESFCYVEVLCFNVSITVILHRYCVILIFYRIFLGIVGIAILSKCCMELIFHSYWTILIFQVSPGVEVPLQEIQP